MNNENKAAIEQLYDVFANWYHDDGSYDTFLQSEALKEIKAYAVKLAAAPVGLKWVSDEEIEKAVKKLSKQSTAPDKETPDWMESDIRRGIMWAVERLSNSYGFTKDDIGKMVEDFIYSDLGTIHYAKHWWIMKLESLQAASPIAAAPVGLNEAKKFAWDMAMTMANNICVQVSDRYNNDDEIEKADGATDCAKQIRVGIGYYPPELISETSLPVSAGEADKNIND